MGTVNRVLPVGLERTFAAIADPATYPHWLVGAREIRSVDPAWPAPGTRFHHRVGLVGPLKVADATEVVEVEPPFLLVLDVRARPFLRARATFHLAAAPARVGDATVVTIHEVPIGPFAALRPVVGPLTDLRNRRSLANLEDFLETGASHRAPG